MYKIWGLYVTISCIINLYFFVFYRSVCPSVNSKPGCSVIKVKLKVKFRKWCNQGAPIIVLWRKMDAGTYRVHWRNCFCYISATCSAVSYCFAQLHRNTAMEISSFWQDFSSLAALFWQLPVQPVMKISSKWHFCFSEAMFLAISYCFALLCWK